MSRDEQRATGVRLHDPPDRAARHRLNPFVRLRHIPSVLAGKVAPLALGRAQYAASSNL